MMETDSNCHFHLLNSRDNPADLLTRGMSYDKFIANTIWRHGPEWLNYEDQWPEQKFRTQMEPTDVTVLEIHETNCQPLFDPQRCNSWKKLIKVTSLVFQFVHKIKGNKTLSDIKPQHYWLSYLQWDSFPEVHQYLKNPLNSKQPELVKNLNLFEHDKLIRCRGRLDRSDLSIHTKFPLCCPDIII